MTSIETGEARTNENSPSGPGAAPNAFRTLLPYLLAIGIQIPMLLLYFGGLWTRPHYQTFIVAILASVGLALYRWPFDAKQPFHRSPISDFLFVVGLGTSLLGAVFVEPWFVACSVMCIVASLFARTLDKESLTNLWPCALPLFVFLKLPCNFDYVLITKLQQYSAIYTSRLLDLAGLGHHMNGVVISIPGMKDYGIEEACSGIQSFFTLMLVAMIFVVASRRVRFPKLGFGVMAMLVAAVLLVIRFTLLSSPFLIDTSTILIAGLLLFALVGFQSTALLLSAVFWAVFMNTIRILAIPLAEHFLEIDLSTGISHDLLGYGVLAIGILLILSTDQFLQFLFGPVGTEESGEMSGGISKFWNNIISGGSSEERLENAKKLQLKRKPVSAGGLRFIWIVAGLIIALGLFQAIDAFRSWSHDDFGLRFFDADMIVDFDKEDLPDAIGGWKQVDYRFTNRHTGADHGQRSDTWQFRSPAHSCSLVTSLDQPFPGWHELTICYGNAGWKLVDRERKAPTGDEDWPYIEAIFEKDTGEKGYLVFSLFNSFGEGYKAPRQYGDWEWFYHAAINRMAHRVRAQLFQGETYQTQVFSTSFNEYTHELKAELTAAHLQIRKQMRDQFMDKTSKEGGGAPAVESAAVEPATGSDASHLAQTP